MRLHAIASRLFCSHFKGMNPQADKRRRAFLKFLESQHLTRGGLTRETGISPNIVYNFLSGKSHYLSQPTLEKIASHYGVPISVLTGIDKAEMNFSSGALHEGAPEKFVMPASQLPAGTVALDVQGVIMGRGIWMETIFSPVEGEAQILLPIPGLYAESAFAVKLSESCSVAQLPPDAFLGCVAIKDYLQRLVPGDLIVAVQRNRLGLFECAVYEYQVEGSRHFLVCETKKAASGFKAELLSPLSDPAGLGFQDIMMHSVVLAYAARLPASTR